MNFTRDPVVETVITPKEGCKLVVRSSKGSSGEDYFVDAVEVVSFGNFLFYRSLERPKSFLLPVSDYEILELKETRMVLKTANSEKSIKIGSVRKEASMEEHEKGSDKRKRRYRKRKISSDHKKLIEKDTKPSDIAEQAKPAPEIKGASDEVKTNSFTRLFPPPSTLIKEKLSRPKELSNEDIFAKDVEEPVIEKEGHNASFSEIATDVTSNNESEKKSNNEE